MRIFRKIALSNFLQYKCLKIRSVVTVRIVLLSSVLRVKSVYLRLFVLS